MSDKLDVDIPGAALIIAASLLILFFEGDPDLQDALIYWLMKCR